MQLFTPTKAGLRWLALLCIGFCLCWLLVPAQARAATGYIADDAHVLDTTTIQSYTDPFSYTVDVYTTTAFTGSNAEFDASVQELAQESSMGDGLDCTPTQQVGCEPVPYASPETYALESSGSSDKSVEIGINVKDRHIAIYGGENVTIAQDHYNKAITAFSTTMHQTHDNYTQATIAALNALEDAGDRFWSGVGHAIPWILLGALFLGFIILRLVGYSQGWWPASSSGSRSRSSEGYHDWSGGGGGDWGGGSSDSGGGGSGASGNF